MLLIRSVNDIYHNYVKDMLNIVSLSNIQQRYDVIITSLRLCHIQEGEFDRLAEQYSNTNN